MARELKARMEFIENHVPAAFNVKPLGFAGDLQTLYSLVCFLRHRLGAFSYDTLATLLDCGRILEGQDREVEDGQNFKKRLDVFCRNKPELAKQTEIAACNIPRKPQK